MVIVSTAVKMKAVVVKGPGSLAALKVEEIARPAVPDDGVLVRVHASSVNPVDLYALTPVAHLTRSLRPAVVGTDFAGTVEAVGRAVTLFQPGDEVFGGGRGAFAEYICVSEQKAVIRKPAGVSFEQAATVVVAGSTALQALRDHGRIKRGQRVLINGASGGVGTFAIQIARAFGARVTAVCSTRHVEVVRSIGADRVIDYTQQDFARAGERYDLMLDVAGNRSWSDCGRVLDRGATYVGVGAAGIQHGPGGGWRAIGHFLNVRLASIGGGRNVVTVFIASLKKDNLVLLGGLLESGQVKPVIEKRYDLDGVSEAIEYLSSGHAGGKIAIEVGRQ
jgi:NADPH:quinone reductase-like Zn-dependent oxidoreductase